MIRLFTLLSISVLIYCLELIYFRIAESFQIIDKPNHRSSHIKNTIRGGGIVFVFSAIIWFISEGFQYPYFFLGLIIISVISFIDDLNDVQRTVRFFVQLLSVSLLCLDASINIGWLWIVPLIVLIVSVINAWNFMDGINGLTGGYSLIAIATLLYINLFEWQFISTDLLVYLIFSLLIFSFFNFRSNARCFAGDVGSISIAFIISFLVILLITKTQNFIFIALGLIYGLDAGVTIILRGLRGENIFQAHRSHLYQVLVHDKGWSHLSVSLMYCVVQLVVNSFVILVFNTNRAANNFPYLLLLIVCTGSIFLALRLKIKPLQKSI